MRLPFLMLIAFALSASIAFAGDIEDGFAARNSGDFSTAFAKFKRAADQGNVKGSYGLALYLNGQGVPRDEKQAIYWFEKVGADGYYGLGEAFRQGEGVTKDPQKAVFWYEKAAAQGSGFIQSQVAWLYKTGDGIPWDDKRAVYWTERSARQGDTLSQLGLANRYRDGLGVTQDIVEAHKWYSLSLGGGLVPGAPNLPLKFLEESMTRQQLAEAQRRAREFTVTQPEVAAPASQIAAVNEPPSKIDYQRALSESVVEVSFALVVGGILFFLLKPRGKLTTPAQMGRLWMAWWCIATALYLTQVVVTKKPSLPEFFIGILPPQLFSLGCAFLGGWLYGRLFKFKTQLAVANDAADEAIYEAAMKELDGGERRSGVWAKALAESDGDEAKAKARYIQYRVQQIKAEAKSGKIAP